LTIPGAIGELTPADFADLDFDDAKGDDYSFFMEAVSYEDDTITFSSGEKGKFAYVDIRNVRAALDSSTVTLTLTLNDDLMGGLSLAYCIFIVNSDHQWDSSLHEPQAVTDCGETFEFADLDNVIVYFRLNRPSDGDWSVSSSEYLPSKDFTVDGNVWQVTVDSAELEDVGVEPGSGFSVYGYCHRNAGYFGETWSAEISWDSAGHGSVNAPNEFNVESTGEGDTTSESMALVGLLLVIVLVVIVGVALFVMSSKKKAEAATPPAYPQQQPGQPPQQQPYQPPPPQQQPYQPPPPQQQPYQPPPPQQPPSQPPPGP
jgi:hypothetical protein